MVSPKRRGRHTRVGDVYFRALVVVAPTMSALARSAAGGKITASSSLGGTSFGAAFNLRRTGHRSALEDDVVI
jgi:hypothetical protein